MLKMPPRIFRSDVDLVGGTLHGAVGVELLSRPRWVHDVIVHLIYISQYLRPIPLSPLNSIPGTNGTCPSYSPGISYGFSANIYDAYASFNLSSVPLTLATSSGDANCFPFANLIGGSGLQGYSQSTYPQCAVPNATNTTVCAYKFTAYNVSCQGRTYEMNTYSSSQAATAEGAYVVHGGGKNEDFL
jgi:hypothetical protein